MWRPEMELIDQLSCAAMPMVVVRRIFVDDEHARRALAMYIDRGVIVFVRGEVPLPEWEANRLLRDDSGLFTREDVCAALTDTGAEAFHSGGWERIK